MTDTVDNLKQHQAQLQSFSALQERHEIERASLAASHQTESSSLAEKHTAEGNLLYSRQAAEQQAFWQRCSDLQQLVQAELSKHKQELSVATQRLEAEKANMEKPDISSGDIINLDICGERTSASRGVLTQAENSFLAAKFSGRWEQKHTIKDGFVFLEFDPYCFKKILSYLRSKAIEGPDHPAPFPVIAPEYEAQFNQLVSHLLLEDFVGFVGMRFLFDQGKCNEHVKLLHSGSAASFAAPEDIQGIGMLAPAMQPGKIYHVKCEIQSLAVDSGNFFFLGVTSNAVSSAIQPEDAGWKGPGRGLTAGDWKADLQWLGWQLSQQYLFKIDLIANNLTVQLCSTQQEWQLPINNISKRLLFFCVLDRGTGTKVKLSPVLSQDVENC